MNVVAQFMKKLKLVLSSNQTISLNNKTSIQAWLESMDIHDYVIHDNLVVDVNQDVNLKNKNLTHLPIQFGIVKGFFDCSYNKLLNLKGMAKEVEGNINCSHNKITSLEDCPKIIQGDLNASFNQIKSLKYMPDEIYDSLIINNNEIKNFQYLTNVRNQISIQNNPINSWLGIGKKIKNKITVNISVINIIENQPEFENLSLCHSSNKAFSFKYFPKVNNLCLNGFINISMNQIMQLDSFSHNIRKEKWRIPQFKNKYMNRYCDEYEGNVFRFNISNIKDSINLNNLQVDMDKSKKCKKIKRPFNTKKQISDWLESEGIKEYVIHDNLVVDVNEDVDFKFKYFKIIPVQFGIVNGSFNISYNKLKTLKGSPHTVKEDFICSSNKLKSLLYSPNNVGGNFNCAQNNLKSLKHSPKEVFSLNCSSNRLKTLEYSPLIKEYLWCGYNQLVSLLHCPEVRTLNCVNNKLTSLKYAPHSLKKLYINNNKLTSLEFCPPQLLELNCTNNELFTLKGCIETINDFNCSHNKLTSLQFGPIKVNNYNCSNNLLNHLDDAPQNCDYFYCTNNQITSLEGLKNITINNQLECSNNNLTTLEFMPSMLTGCTCLENPITTFKHCLKTQLVSLSCSFDSLTDFENIPTPFEYFNIRVSKKIKYLENIQLKSKSISLNDSKIQFGKNVYVECQFLTHEKNEKNYFIKGLHHLYTIKNKKEYFLNINSDDFNTIFNANYEKKYLDKLIIENDTIVETKFKRKKI
jgi:hypothetical protein